MLYYFHFFLLNFNFIPIEIKKRNCFFYTIKIKRAFVDLRRNKSYWKSIDHFLNCRLLADINYWYIGQSRRSKSFSLFVFKYQSIEFHKSDRITYCNLHKNEIQLNYSLKKCRSPTHMHTTVIQWKCCIIHRYVCNLLFTRLTIS